MELALAGGRQTISKYIKKIILDADTFYESKFDVVLYS